jgi:hypothetical protein
MKTIIFGLLCAGACILQSAEPSPPKPAPLPNIDDIGIGSDSAARGRKAGMAGKAPDILITEVDDPSVEKQHVGPDVFTRSLYSRAEPKTYSVPPELKNFRKTLSPFILTNAGEFGIKADDWMSDTSSIIYDKGTYHCWVIHQYRVPRTDGNSWVLHITTTDTYHWKAAGYVPLGPKDSCYDNQINSGDVVFHEGKWYFFGGASSTNRKKYVQGIVCMVADAPEGPWKQVGDDYVLKPGRENIQNWDFGGMDNPEITYLNGKWFMYYKSLSRAQGSVPRAGRFTNAGVATSDSITGPYTKYDKNPLFQAHGQFAFRYKQGIVMVPFGSDAVQGPMWSEDGIHFTGSLENDYYSPFPKKFFCCGSLYVPHDPLFGNPASDKPVTKYWGLDNIKTRNWHLVRMEWEFGPSKPGE